MTGRPIAVVTGGAGFIGSHMVDVLLDNGYAVRVIDNLVGGHEINLAHHAANPDLACEWADIRSLPIDAAVFSGARHVLHFAGIGDIVPSIEQPIDYMSTNVMGTVQALECARHAGVARKTVYDHIDDLVELGLRAAPRAHAGRVRAYRQAGPPVEDDAGISGRRNSAMPGAGDYC